MDINETYNIRKALQKARVEVVLQNMEHPYQLNNHKFDKHAAALLPLS